MQKTLYNKEYLDNLIKNEASETLMLEFKAGGALDKSPKKKIEITKDVSALANSDGGILIYGLREDANKQFAETIDPVNGIEFNEEWLQQIITQIRPSLQVKIFPVKLDESKNEIVYILEVPKGNTAHQALDKKYHRRRGTITDAMDDYEVRDVFGRNIHPVINLDFRVVQKTTHIKGNEVEISPYIKKTADSTSVRTWLEVFAINEGDVLAKFINVSLEIPTGILESKFEQLIHDHTTTYDGDNRITEGGTIENPNGGISQFIPLLPKKSRYLYFGIPPLHTFYRDYKKMISWKIYADNAPVRSGEILINDIVFSMENVYH